MIINHIEQFRSKAATHIPLEDRAALIRADGTMEIVALPSGADSGRLEAIQGHVGGFFEPLRITSDSYLLLNEDAKLVRNPPKLNQKATALARRVLRPNGFIIGDVLLVDVSAIR